MDKLWQTVGIPLLIIIGGSLLYQFTQTIVQKDWFFILELIRAFCFFSFGMALHTYKKKRSSAWVGKLLISFVMFFFICFQLGYLDGFQPILQVLRVIGLTHSIMAIPLIYILCGYVFFQ